MLTLSSFVSLPIHCAAFGTVCWVLPCLSLFPLQLVYGEHWLSVLDFYPWVDLIASLGRAVWHAPPVSVFFKLASGSRYLGSVSFHWWHSSGWTFSCRQSHKLCCLSWWWQSHLLLSPRSVTLLCPQISGSSCWWCLCSPVTKERQWVVSPDAEMLTSVSCEQSRSSWWSYFCG